MRWTKRGYEIIEDDQRYIIGDSELYMISGGILWYNPRKWREKYKCRWNEKFRDEKLLEVNSLVGPNHYT